MNLDLIKKRRADIVNTANAGSRMEAQRCSSIAAFATTGEHTTGC